MATRAQIERSKKSGVFIKGVPFKLKRLSKSKLKQHDGCPRAFWFSQVLGRKEYFPPSTLANFTRGNAVHRLHEHFLKYFANNPYLIRENPDGFIKEYFTPLLDKTPYPEYVRGLMLWEMKRWKRYQDMQSAGLIFDAVKYFLPIILPDGKPAVELKIYSEKLDWVSIIDSAFWLPPNPKKKETEDKILIVDDKTGKHNPAYYSPLRMELTFMWRVAKELNIFGKTPELTSIFWPLSQDVLLLKPGKVQFKALDRRVDRLDHSIKHDIWPCQPGTDLRWSPCKWCPHSDICPRDLNEDYRFPAQLELTSF